MTKSKGKNSKKTTDYNRVEISRKLKRGEVSRIASETGFSASHVRNVLKGRRNNEEILKFAQKLTARRK
jgi:hypothetical protein